MKGLYRRLAFGAMRKNYRYYLPYILACLGMTGMYFILAALSEGEILLSFRGGDIMRTILHLGCGVLMVFSLLFLFYTNAFLLRRRKKEFGLYNVLGMGKRHLMGVCLWEGVSVALLSILGGILLGLLFSKAAELLMVHLLGMRTDFRLRINVAAMLQTAAVFGVIHLLLLLHTLYQVARTDPLSLLRSESAGEKPPRANFLAALLGAVLLGLAYYLAVSIEDPVTALIWFFVAVILVILGTYLLFISGSVALCRLLQKNKRYYYKTNHFVSVSTMAFRMKRNGAGLASICILCTMVLVMLASTVCLYIGSTDSLMQRYPRQILLSARLGALGAEEEEALEALRTAALAETAQCGLAPENMLEYHLLEASVYRKGEDAHVAGTAPYDEESELWELRIAPLSDYERLTGETVDLADDEALYFATQGRVLEEETLRLQGGSALRIAGQAEEIPALGDDVANVSPVLYLFVPNFEAVASPLLALTNSEGSSLADISWTLGFDTDGTDQEQMLLYEDISQALEALKFDLPEDSYVHARVECRAEQQEGFYSLYGGLFFLGVTLGIVFLFAAVLMIYYKQISEGYEDRARFDIMQRVGMTRREIRRSINSQVLTVFFLPMLTAGLHLCFAFPLLYRLLILFGVMDFALLMQTTALCFLAFALLYTAVYRVTSGAYYRIVSGAGRGEA